MKILNRGRAARSAVFALGIALLVASFLAGCANQPYRLDYSQTAPFEAYRYFTILERHPFDAEHFGPAQQAALSAALADQLSGLGTVAEATGVDQNVSLVFAFSADVQAGRVRVAVLAANGVNNWRYQFDRRSSIGNMIALEVYESRTGDIFWRAEAQAQTTPEQTVAKLMSGFPPPARRSARVIDGP